MTEIPVIAQESANSISAVFTQSGFDSSQSFQANFSSGLEALLLEADSTAGTIAQSFEVAAQGVGNAFGAVFDDIDAKGKQAAAQTKQTAKETADVLAKSVNSKSVNTNGFVGNPAKDPFGGSGSSGGNILDFLKLAAGDRQGNQVGVVFQDKQGNVLSPEVVARETIKALGGTAEAVSKVTGFVGDLAAQANAIANRVEKDYRANGIQGIQLPPRFGDAFNDLLVPKRLGGVVYPDMDLSKIRLTNTCLLYTSPSPRD